MELTTTSRVRAQREARALGDPTRYRLFRYIADADDAVTVAELTDLVKINHTAVRQHLAVLKNAGLVLEEIERCNRPGRPRLLYRASPEAMIDQGSSGAYAWLATMLTDAVRRGLDPRQVGREEGGRLAATATGYGDPADVLEHELAERGFRPVRQDSGDVVELVLRRCPFAQVAEHDPSTVCQIHLGLAEGLSEAIGGMGVDRMLVGDLNRGGCRLILRRAVRSDPEIVPKSTPWW